MSSKLEEIIEKINDRLEQLALFEEYKPKEREELARIIKENTISNLSSNSKFKISDLLLAAAIVGDKYENIDDVIETFEFFEDLLNAMTEDEIRSLYIIISTAKRENKVEDLLAKMKKTEQTGIFKAKKMLSSFLFDKKQFEFTEILKVLLIADEDLFQVTIPVKKFMDIITQFNSEEEEILNTFDFINSKMKKSARKDFNSMLKQEFNFNRFYQDIKKINDYYTLIEKENSKQLRSNTKEANQLSQLKKILLDSKDKKEIVNISTIINLVPIELEEEILRYVALKNQTYYDELETEYKKVSENSINNYISLFNTKNINFNSYPKEQQQLLLNIEFSEIEEILKFLELIEYPINKNVIYIILNTNVKIINTIKEYVKRGILTYKFVCENIDIIFDSEPTINKSVFKILSANINTLIDANINIIGLDENSLDVFLTDPILLKNNLDIINNYNINIKTRNLKDYSFLKEENLEEKITKLQKLNVNINKNINIINSDYNIVKRIEICLNIGLDIYEDGQIKEEILNKDLFFIPDELLDNYLVKDKAKKI